MYKIAYAAGSRADYGIVRNYLKKLQKDKEISLDILVTGSLLETQYGSAIHLIEEDGFRIKAEFPLQLCSVSNAMIIKSMSLALEQFGAFFEKNKYDNIIILGDRYEMLSVAIAAAMNRIPILHIHGGEITLGNYDEFIRHSITKMSHYHFTSTEEYRKRVIQLGENPDTVFNIGAMGSENCKHICFRNVSDTIKKLSEQKYFVVLFHPETLTNVNHLTQVKELLASIEVFSSKYAFIFIGSNADTGSEVIRTRIKEYADKNSNAFYFENLHPDEYHYLLTNSVALIGNSSSGIIEAPTLGGYTINIGDRQTGRVRGTSVFDVKCNQNEIRKAINHILLLPKVKELPNPYFKENASEHAYQLTLEILKNQTSCVKEFFDLKTTWEL